MHIFIIAFFLFAQIQQYSPNVFYRTPPLIAAQAPNQVQAETYIKALSTFDGTQEQIKNIDFSGVKQTTIHACHSLLIPDESTRSINLYFLFIHSYKGQQHKTLVGISIFDKMASYCVTRCLVFSR